MKNLTKNLLAAALLACACIAGVGCDRPTENPPETTDFYEEETETTSAETEKAPPTVLSAPSYFIQNTKLEFVGEEQKLAWKDALTRLLSNVQKPIPDGDSIIGYAPTDPNAPSVAPGYACALMDINLDGTPEVLVHPYGYFGSSGTSTYFAYDLYTGEQMGTIDGGIDETLCVYYDMTTEKLCLLVQYGLRLGWEERERFICKVDYSEEAGEYINQTLFFTYHRIEVKEIEEDCFDEVYADTRYRAGGKDVSLDDYYYAYDEFLRYNIRIPETEFCVIRWDEVCDHNDSDAVKAEKMAQALVTSQQQFLTAPNSPQK